MSVRRLGVPYNDRTFTKVLLKRRRLENSFWKPTGTQRPQGKPVWIFSESAKEI